MKSALFWDYENVPLKQKTANRFLLAMKNMFDNIDFDFRQVYARKSTLPEIMQSKISSFGFKKHDFKWVIVDEKNAVDFSLMESCIYELKINPEIKQIVLISGDGDFKHLMNNLVDKRVVVVCQKGNYSKTLTNTVSEAYSYEFVIANYKAWYLGQ